MTDNPSKATPEVEEMREGWGVVTPLLGGTKAMRASKELLPQFPAEEDKTYNARLQQSTLFPVLAETVNNMVSRVFAEPLQLGDDVPEPIRSLADNIDLSGCDLNSWAVDFFKTGLSYGLNHALIEFPRAEGLRTRADELAAGVRPYVVTVKPTQVLGWRSDNGKLTQFRYMETVEENDGRFGAKKVKQIRVLEPGKWEVFRESEKKDEWILHDEGRTSLNEIPLVTYYTGRTGFMTAKPPLMELAYLNVKHWQSQSDQDNLLHVARVPLLFTFTDDEQFELKISAGSATQMPKDGNAKYVEHSGAAIDAGRTALQDLVSEMRMAGAKLLQKDGSKVMTAAQAENENEEELSPIARMAHQLQDALEQILGYMARYSNQQTGGSVEIRGNFDQITADSLAVPAMSAMAEKGQLSYQTLFAEMQRRGVISDEYTWDEEMQRILDQTLLDDEQ